MRRHRFTFLLRTTVAGLLMVASIGGFAGCSSPGTQRDSTLRQSNSSLNTASQKTFENSASFVDVPDDDPVSMPRERVIYPPSTGNAGTATQQSVPLETLALLGVAVTLLTFTRRLTRPLRSSPS
jgi:hypothetical protein